MDEPTSLAVATLDAGGSAHYDFYFDGTAGLGWDDSVVELAPTSGVLHLSSIATWRPPSAARLQAVQRTAYDSGATLVCYDPNARPALIADRDATRASIEGASRPRTWSRPATKTSRSSTRTPTSPRWPSGGATWARPSSWSRWAVRVRWPFGADGEVARRPGEQITVADTVGAGDSFAAGLLAALGDVRPSELVERIPDALRQAVVVSAMTCERDGADPPTRAELDERLARLDSS